MLTEIKDQGGGIIPRHRHEAEQIIIVQKGEARVSTGKEPPRVVKAGDIWIVPADGSAKPRRLTAGKSGESGASWSPGGKRIAFTAKRDGDEANQVYVLDLSGGEAQRITTLTPGARSPRWSPDGKTILFQSSVWRGAADEDANKKLNEERKNAKSKVRAYDGFPIRQCANDD